jgi:hypothetical protein
VDDRDQNRGENELLEQQPDLGLVDLRQDIEQLARYEVKVCVWISRPEVELQIFLLRFHFLPPSQTSPSLFVQTPL